MPWDSGGAFNRLYSWVADANAGFDILADRMDDDTNDLAQGVARCRNLDGFNQPSIDLLMAGHRHTGVGAATAADHYARFDQVVPAAGGNFTGAVNAPSGTIGSSNLTGTGITTNFLSVAGAADFGSTVTFHGNIGAAGAVIGSSSLSGTGIATNFLSVANIANIANLNAASAVIGGFLAAAGQFNAINTLGSIGVIPGAIDDGRVDAAGGFYVSGVPHLLADARFGALFAALGAAPEGAAMLVVKDRGRLEARAVGVAPADAAGRRNLYLPEG